MSTICFDIKRVDDDYVCIQHCGMNEFTYQYHLPLSFYPRERKGKEHWWLEDKKYRYVWIAIKKEKETGIERPVWACNDKIWFNSAVKEFFKDDEIRVLKLPFDEKVSTGNKNFPYRYETTDLKNRFKLYCPVDLNEKHHIYADHYEEIESTIDKVVELDNGKKFEFKTRQFKWIPPKQLEM